MIIDFEGFAGANAGLAVPNGYAHMNWTNWELMDAHGSIFDPSGLVNGAVTGPAVAFNNFSNPATFATQGADFDLKKCWFTGAWNNGVTVTVQAWDDGTLVGEKHFKVNYAGPTKIKFGPHFDSIDTVIISSSGGTEANLSDAGSGSHVVIDRLVVAFEHPAEEPLGVHHGIHGLEHPHDLGGSPHDHGSGFADWMLA